jgi:hypothetical protein
MANYHRLKHTKTGDTREIRQGFSALFLYLAPLCAFFTMKVFEFFTGRLGVDDVLRSLQDPLGDIQARIVFLAAFAVFVLLGYFVGMRYNGWKVRYLCARRGYQADGGFSRTFPELVTRYSVAVMPSLQGAPYRFVRLDYIFAGAAFLLAFLVYFLTLTPELDTGDAGELTTALYSLGAAHPPGYPLYTMLGKIFTYLPIGSVAYRINFMSAFFGAFTIFFFFLFVFRLLHRAREEGAFIMRDRFIALAGSLLFAFSLTMWEQAIQGELYSLNAFFAPLLLLAALVWQENVFSSLRAGRPSYADKYILLLAILIGLAFTNHLLLLGYIPPLAFFFLVVTQFMSEPDFRSAVVSQRTANVIVLSLVALMCFLMMVIFGEMVTLLTRALFAVFIVSCLGAAGMLLATWVKSMCDSSRLSRKVQYACGGVVAASFGLAAVLVFANAWSVSLLDDADAARTLVAIFIPLITLGLAAIFLMRKLSCTKGKDRTAQPAAGAGEKKRRRLLFWGIGVWTFLFLLVIFEEGIFSLLRVFLFFLPSSWLSDTAVREGLDFIGVGWGFDAVALLVYVLGVVIGVFAYMRAKMNRLHGTQVTAGAESAKPGFAGASSGNAARALPLGAGAGDQGRERFAEISCILFKCSLFALLPMLLYMTLIIRANAIAKIPDPPLSWGETINASRTINHFLRKQYPKASMYFYNRIPEISDGWMKMHVEQYLPISSSKGSPWTAGEVLIALPVFLCLVALGMWALWRRNRLWFWFLLACFVTFNILLTTMLSPKDTPRDWYFNAVFYAPSHLIVAVWFTFALQQMAISLARKRGRVLVPGAPCASDNSAEALPAPLPKEISSSTSETPVP